MQLPILAIKVDVETVRGARLGVPKLIKLFQELNIPASFFFSLRKEKTGNLVKNIFRKNSWLGGNPLGAFRVYGWRSLFHRFLMPSKDMSKSCFSIMRDVKEAGFEVVVYGCDSPIACRYGKKFQTQQMLTNLPTLKELLKQKDFPLQRLILYYISKINDESPNVLSINTELEGIKYFEWFREFLLVLQKIGINFQDFKTVVGKQ